MDAELKWYGGEISAVTAAGVKFVVGLSSFGYLTVALGVAAYVVVDGGWALVGRWGFGLPDSWTRDQVVKVAGNDVKMEENVNYWKAIVRFQFSLLPA